MLGLRDVRILGLDDVVTQVAIAVRRVALGIFSGRRAIAQGALNERSGLKQTSSTREPSCFDQADGYSFVRILVISVKQMLPLCE